MKRRNKRRYIFIFLFLFLYGCGRETPPLPKIGGPFPDFKYMDMEGKKGSIKGLKGSLILIHFWVECPDCRVEMPLIDELYKEYVKKGSSVLAINEKPKIRNVKQNKEKVEAFVEELNLSFPIILDKDAQIAKLCRVWTIPTNFIVDRNGILREIIIGEVFKEKSSLKKLIDPYL